jgi:sec-independent protein translocase protein TatC
MPDLPVTHSTHLDELRKRIIPVIFSIVFFTGISFYFAKDLIWILKWPASGQIDTLAVFSPTAAILAYMKIACTAGVACSLPVFLYEAWMFIAPALDPRHAKSGLLFIVSGTLLFFSGAAFNFFLLIPASIRFLMSLGKGDLQFLISLESYVSFVLGLILAGGLVFEMPVLAFILAKFGILTTTKAVKGWRVAVIIILIVAAVLTPTPDVVNMLLMSLPMFVLYCICVGVVAFAENKKLKLGMSLK